MRRSQGWWADEEVDRSLGWRGIFTPRPHSSSLLCPLSGGHYVGVVSAWEGRRGMGEEASPSLKCQSCRNSETSSSPETLSICIRLSVYQLSSLCHPFTHLSSSICLSTFLPTYLPVALRSFTPASPSFFPSPLPGSQLQALEMAGRR